ncbi:holothin acyltransferase-like [Oculina patagonica]
MALLAFSRGFAARHSISRFAFACSRRTLGKETDPTQFAKPYTCMPTMEEFKIRLIETKEEYESVIINAMVKEGWRPGLKDAECYHACDPTAAFVGELNGKPIGCITVTKYGDSFAFGGCYIVSKEHRGTAYSRKIFDAAFASVKPPRSIGISALLELEKMYKRKGFRSHFYGARFVFHLPTAITRFSEASERSPVKIKRIEEVNSEALFMYDTAVFGFKRRAFLSKWLGVTGSHARVAIDSEGSIVGYTVARPMFVKEEGYKIGPLFADSEPIAEKLLKAVFEELLGQGDPAVVVSLDTLTKKATELGERLQGKRSMELVYMVMGDPPDACFDKSFGYTTIELG